MAKHSHLGASSAPRWLKCPASVKAIASLPTRKESSNPYADRGTAAHWVLEQCLIDVKKHPLDYIDYEYVFKKEDGEPDWDRTIVLDEEDCEAVEEAYDFIIELMENGHYKMGTEVKFHLEVLDPDLYGTSDVVLVEQNLKQLLVIDYKHGAGVPVDVKENRQLMYYGLGAIWSCHQKLQTPDPSLLGWGSVFEEVELIVIQPRSYHSDGAIRRWVLPEGRLDEYAQELLQGVKRTREEDPEFKAGDHCRWCEYKPCLAMQNMTSEIAQTEFTDLTVTTLPKLEMMDVKDIVNVLNHSDLIKQWLKSVHSYAQQLRESGQEVPGYKLVQGKKNRAWHNPDRAEAALSFVLPEEDLMVKKIKSPAQIEKLLKKKKLKYSVNTVLAHKPEGSLTLVPEHDKREPVEPVANDFDVIEEGDNHV